MLKDAQKDVNIKEVYQGVKNKAAVFDELLAKYNLTPAEAAYMGDDIPDICILEKVELAGCPSDAVEEVKEIANFESSKKGGCGAVREFCDCILRLNRN